MRCRQCELAHGRTAGGGRRASATRELVATTRHRWHRRLGRDRAVDSAPSCTHTDWGSSACVCAIVERRWQNRRWHIRRLQWDGRDGAEVCTRPRWRRPCACSQSFTAGDLAPTALQSCNRMVDTAHTCAQVNDSRRPCENQFKTAAAPPCLV